MKIKLTFCVYFQSKKDVDIYMYTLKIYQRTLICMIHNNIEASCGAAARSLTVKPIGYGFDPHSRRWNIYLNLYFHFFALVSRQSAAALSSATQDAMPPEFGKKWGMVCLNTRFPLPVCTACIQRKANLIFNFTIIYSEFVCCQRKIL